MAKIKGLRIVERQFHIRLSQSILSVFITEKKTSKVDLNGKKIVFTGALTKATRKQAAARAKMFGCIVVAGVSKNVDIVIAGSGAGQKLDRTEDLGMNQ